MTRVLIVEDDRTLLRALAMNLTARGYEVTEARDRHAGAQRGRGRRARRDRARPRAARHRRPRRDQGRARYAATPIIVLSARTGTSDKVAALDLGADDYVTKPFSIDELLARLRAATRRVGDAANCPT